jgi:hypothetical protein
VEAIATRGQRDLTTRMRYQDWGRCAPEDARTKDGEKASGARGGVGFCLRGTSRDRQGGAEGAAGALFRGICEGRARCDGGTKGGSEPLKCGKMAEMV